MSTLECYGSHTIHPDCNYDITVANDGTTNTDLSGHDFIGYGTTPTIQRICLPNTNVLQNAFQEALENTVSAIQNGQFASLTEDVSNVIYILIFYRIGNGYYVE